VERLALLLGVCATLTTLVAWGTALAPDDRRAATSAGEHAQEPAWQVVERPGGRFAVPPVGAGWRVSRPREVLYYADQRGTPVAGVAGPAVLDEGYCAAGDGPSNRAFAGLLPPARGTARGVVGRLTREWAAAVAGPGGDPTAVRAERAVLADGSTAVRTHTVVPVAPGSCRPTRVALDLIGTEGGSGVVTLVLVRDVGPDALRDAVAERILYSLRSRT
jgi:hypothetical protein